MALSEGITQELVSRSKGLYTHQESSMYPTLYQVVKKEMISGRQKKVLKTNKKKLSFFFSNKLIKNLKNHLFHSSYPNRTGIPAQRGQYFQTDHVKLDHGQFPKIFCAAG